MQVLRDHRKPARAVLVSTLRHHAPATNRSGDAVLSDADHRRHALVELAIRDLEEDAGLSHLPTSWPWAEQRLRWGTQRCSLRA